MPKTNNRRVAARPNTTGDANIDLYLRAGRAVEKRDKNTSDYEYEKNAEECRFYPDTSKSNTISRTGNQNVTILATEHDAINGHVQRLARARKEKEFK